MSSAMGAIPNILSIAGTDPSGGAGIHADIKSISANGGYAMAVVTALVAQTPVPAGASPRRGSWHRLTLFHGNQARSGRERASAISSLCRFCVPRGLDQLGHVTVLLASVRERLPRIQRPAKTTHSARLSEPKLCACSGGLDTAWAREIRHKSLSVTTEPGGPRLVGEAMQVTDDPKMTVLSELADVRDVPLADMLALGLVTHHLVERAAPGLLITSAPAAGAAFQSAI